MCAELKCHGKVYICLMRPKWFKTTSGGNFGGTDSIRMTVGVDAMEPVRSGSDGTM